MGTMQGTFERVKRQSRGEAPRGRGAARQLGEAALVSGRLRPISVFLVHSASVPAQPSDAFFLCVLHCGLSRSSFVRLGHCRFTIYHDAVSVCGGSVSVFFGSDVVMERSLHHAPETPHLCGAVSAPAGSPTHT